MTTTKQGDTPQATDTYEVLDFRTGVVVAKATGLRAASRKAERRNQSYGAVRYGYRREVR